MLQRGKVEVLTKGGSATRLRALQNKMAGDRQFGMCSARHQAKSLTAALAT
jgi:hypothetical protein